MNVLWKRKRKYCFNKLSVIDESGKFIILSKFKCFKNVCSSGSLKFFLNFLKFFLSLGNGGNVLFFGNI